MSRNNLDGAWIRASRLLQSMGFGIEKVTSGATITLVSDAPTCILATLTGSGQNIVLPAPSTLLEGRFFLIFNTSASALSATVKQNDGTTTLITIAQNKAGIVVCDGTTWVGLLGA